MNKFLKQNWLFITVSFLIIVGAFYWYEWRPAQIKKECFNQGINFGSTSTNELDEYYKNCLRRNGL